MRCSTVGADRRGGAGFMADGQNRQAGRKTERQVALKVTRCLYFRMSMYNSGVN